MPEPHMCVPWQCQVRPPLATMATWLITVYFHQVCVDSKWKIMCKNMLMYGLSWIMIFFGHQWGDSSNIFMCDTVTSENCEVFYQQFPLVTVSLMKIIGESPHSWTKKLLFMLGHTLFCVQISNHFVVSAWTKQMTFPHDEIIKWKHFPCYWPIVRGIHRSPVNSPHKGQCHGALMFSMICAWTNSWVNNQDVGIWDAIIVIMMSL